MTAAILIAIAGLAGVVLLREGHVALGICTFALCLLLGAFTGGDLTSRTSSKDCRRSGPTIWGC